MKYNFDTEGIKLDISGVKIDIAKISCSIDIENNEMETVLKEWKDMANILFAEFNAGTEDTCDKEYDCNKEEEDLKRECSDLERKGFVELVEEARRLIKLGLCSRCREINCLNKEKTSCNRDESLDYFIFFNNVGFLTNPMISDNDFIKLKFIMKVLEDRYLPEIREIALDEFMNNNPHSLGKQYTKYSNSNYNSGCNNDAPTNMFANMSSDDRINQQQQYNNFVDYLQRQLENNQSNNFPNYHPMNQQCSGQIQYSPYRGKAKPSDEHIDDINTDINID